MEENNQLKYVFDVKAEYEKVTEAILSLNDKKVGWPFVSVNVIDGPRAIYEISDPLEDKPTGIVRVGRGGVGKDLTHIIVEESMFGVVETALKKSEISYTSRRKGMESGRFSVTPYSHDHVRAH